MGDFRADIKIKMESLGKNYKMGSWINYTPESECYGVDQRIIDFFRNAWDDIKSRHDKKVAKYFEEQHKEEIEKQERAELERLKDKYELTKEEVGEK